MDDQTQPAVMRAVHVPGVLAFTPPQGQQSIPLVFDSPHSGAQYPADFRHCLDELSLWRLQDAFVDDLYDHVPGQGASLLSAQFPRSYIDPNRAADDIDVGMFAEPWPDDANPTQKTRNGIGLLFRLAADGPVYNRKLSIDEARTRIDDYYWPYHHLLENILDHTWRQHGRVLHVNCHSMKSVSTRTSPEGVGNMRPDFILGDRDGSACAPDITHAIAQFLRDRGYRVAVNDPYKGVELVKRYSDPSNGRHSMQIELNRALYMNEKQITKHDGFTEFKQVLRDMTQYIGTLI